MCKRKSSLIYAGMAMIAVGVIAAVMIVVDAVYKISGQVGEVPIEVNYWLIVFCVTVRLEAFCDIWTDDAFEDTGAQLFYIRSILTFLFLFLIVTCAVLLFLFTAVHCCNFIDIKRGVWYKALIAATVLMLLFAIIMPIIPTIEYVSEKKTFKDSRKDSFYYKVLNEVALVNYLNFTNEIDLIDSIGSPDVTMTFTWAIIAPYSSIIFIVIALILFIIAGKKTKESDSKTNELGGKENLNESGQKEGPNKSSKISRGENKRLKSLTDSEKIPPHRTIPAHDRKPTIYGYGTNRKNKGATKSGYSQPKKISHRYRNPNLKKRRNRNRQHRERKM